MKTGDLSFFCDGRLLEVMQGIRRRMGKVFSGDFASYLAAMNGLSQ